MLLRIAEVLKSHGADGALVIGFRGTAPQELNVNEPVFLYYDGLPVPFFVESLDPKGPRRALVRLTGIRNLRDAEEAAGRSVYIEGPDTEEESAFAGWTVTDPEGQTVGTVAGEERIPGNPCLAVRTVRGQVLLPFHEELILSAEERTRTLVLQIPQGLI